MVYDPEYYQNNREHIIKKSLEHYQANRAKIIERLKLYNKVYYLEHREELREKQKRYRESHARVKLPRPPKPPKPSKEIKLPKILKNKSFEDLKNIPTIEDKPQVIFTHGNFVVSFD